MTRRGFSLAELLVSLSVFGIIVALAAHGSAGQLRFFSGLSVLAAARAQTAQAGIVPARLLWGIAPAGGDVIAATPSTLEFHAATGVAVACDQQTGSALVPDAGVLEFGQFFRRPEPGDRLHVHVSDSLGSGWVETRVTSVLSSPFGCALFPQATGTLALELEHDFVVPAGSVLRLSRRMRLRHYRASDGDWYLGLQEWDGVGGKFSTVQPVAGPLASDQGDPGSPGLEFVYLDSSGSQLEGSFDTGNVAVVLIATRSAQYTGGLDASPIEPIRQHYDSTITSIALRNAP